MQNQNDLSGCLVLGCSFQLPGLRTSVQLSQYCTQSEVQSSQTSTWGCLAANYRQSHRREPSNQQDSSGDPACTPFAILCDQSLLDCLLTGLESVHLALACAYLQSKFFDHHRITESNHDRRKIGEFASHGRCYLQHYPSRFGK